MTYDYECPTCGHDWEIEQTINDAPIKKCPANNCRGRSLKKVISQNTVGWKLNDGKSGWGRNGYAG